MDGKYKKLNKVVYTISNSTFLEGIASNELTKPDNSFLDAFGKVIVYFYQQNKGKELSIVFEEEFEQDFIKHIDKYIKLAKSSYKKIEGEVLHIIDDKKIGELHFQLPIGYITLVPSLESLSLTELSEEDYTVLRLENNIFVQGKDFSHEMFLNTGIDAVSFTKGCFLGQEVMARVQNLAKPSKKIMRIAYDTLPENVTVNGNIVGKITTSGFSRKYKKYLAFSMMSNYDQTPDSGQLL